jgi:hypothetical protein
MIRANCRARFTAADFDFIVRPFSRQEENERQKSMSFPPNKFF